MLCSPDAHSLLIEWHCNFLCDRLGIPLGQWDFWINICPVGKPGNGKCPAQTTCPSAWWDVVPNSPIPGGWNGTYEQKVVSISNVAASELPRPLEAKAPADGIFCVHTWADLSKDTRAAWTALDWNAAKWNSNNANNDVATEKLDYNQLNAAQLAAATKLGIDKQEWDALNTDATDKIAPGTCGEIKKGALIGDEGTFLGHMNATQMTTSAGRICPGDNSAHPGPCAVECGGQPQSCGLLGLQGTCTDECKAFVGSFRSKQCLACQKSVVGVKDTQWVKYFKMCGFTTGTYAAETPCNTSRQVSTSNKHRTRTHMHAHANSFFCRQLMFRSSSKFSNVANTPLFFVCVLGGP